MTWGMKHEMVKSSVAVDFDLLDRLVGVGRNNPSPRYALDRKCVHCHLHLDRIGNAVLLLRTQRQRCPEADVLERFGAVRVVADLDLDHSIDVDEIPLGLGGTFFGCRQKALGIQPHAFARGADEPIAGAAGVAGCDWAACGDVDRDAVSGAS